MSMISSAYPVHSRMEAEETQTEQEGDRKVASLRPQQIEKETVLLFLGIAGWHGSC